MKQAIFPLILLWNISVHTAQPPQEPKKELPCVSTSTPAATTTTPPTTASRPASEPALPLFIAQLKHKGSSRVLNGLLQ